MKLIKNKKTSGLTLIESLITIVISISVLVFILAFIGRNISDDNKRKEVAEDLSSLMKAMINRIDVDNGVLNTNTKEYKTSGDLTYFVKLLNGKDSNCGVWNPSSTNTSLNDTMKDSYNVSCGYFKNKKLGAISKAVVDKSDDSISVIFDYNNSKMKDNIINWVNISNELIISPKLVGYGSQSYGFIDKISGDTMSNKDCALNHSNCAFKMSYRLSNESEGQYLSTIGENMQVGKIKFTNGMLNPQVCKNWSIKDDGTIVEQEDVFCGIDNKDGKVSFKLNNIETDNVTVGGECRMIETDIGYSVVDYDEGTFPCGLIKIRRDTDTNRQLIVGSVADATSVGTARTRMSSTVRNDATISTHEIQTVGHSMKSYDVSTNVLTIDSGLRALQLSTNEFKTTHSYIYNLDATKNKNQYDNIKALVAKIDGVNRTNEISTARLHTNEIRANGITFDGDLKIDGDLNVNNYNGSGTLRSDDILDSGSKNFNLRSSAFLGGYIEVGGIENKEKVGISGLNSISTKGNYIQGMNHQNYNGKRLSLNNNGNETFAIHQNEEAQWIKGGVTQRSAGGFTNYLEADGASGRLSFKTLENRLPIRFTGSGMSGLVGGVPSQVLGNIITTSSTNYTIIINERFDDVTETNIKADIDLSGLENFSSLGKNYKRASLKEGSPRTHIISVARALTQNRVLVAENNAKGEAPKGPTGLQGARGLQGVTGDVGLNGGIGVIGQTGAIYQEDLNIWLSVDQYEPIQCMTKSEASKQGSLWTYKDVIEGECDTEGEVKYFQDTSKRCDYKILDKNKGYNTEVYKCQKAIKRLEPHAYNIIPLYSICDLGFDEKDIVVDDLPNITIDAEGNLRNDNGDLVNKDGKLIDKDGKLINENGDFVDKDGNVIIEEVLPNITIDDDGNLRNDDGHLVNEKGKLVDEDGNLINSNGDFVNEDGQLIDEDGNIIEEEVEDEFEAPVFETDKDKINRLKSKFESQKYVLGAGKDKIFNDCKSEGDRYFTRLKNSEVSKKAKRITINDFGRYLNNEKLWNTTPLNCEKGNMYLVSKCENSGVKESDYRTHPAGFLESIGR